MRASHNTNLSALHVEGKLIHQIATQKANQQKGRCSVHAAPRAGPTAKLIANPEAIPITHHKVTMTAELLLSMTKCLD